MSQYAVLVKRAALYAMLVASTLLLVKLIVWWQTGSVTLLASLVDSLLDLAASCSSLLILSFSLQPADDEHSFGHGKAESLAALAQSTFIAGSSLFLVLSGIERFFHPQELVKPELGIWVSLFAIIVTGVLVLYQKHVVKLTGSEAIKADSLHYQSDLLMNATVMLALFFSSLGWPMADAIFGIAIGFYILKSAWEIGYQAVQSLLDHRLPQSEMETILALALAVDNVEGVHDLRTRMSGETRFIQMHLELRDDLLLIQAHQIADKVEEALIAAFPGSDVLIHQDPMSVVKPKPNK
ncbi:MAG: cation diffusion facilitator family transporter [Oceanospirillaceae bacterium]|nr:cation diffusion facilitator family transporter [Oceanospirillaceae bacterium]